MAYARRSTYRRKGRRGNRTLSTRRIFANKGARSQAKQIYALRKSVNRVRRQCRPEVKEVEGIYDNRLLSEAELPLTPEPWYRLATPLPELGTDDGQRIGNIVKLLPLKFRMTLQYREDFQSQQYPAFAELPQHGIQVRVIAVQAKAVADNQPTLEDILDSVHFNGYLNSSAMMVQPFKRGITARYNILYNRVFSVSKDKPQLARSISIVPKIRSLRYEATSGSQPRGRIYVFVFQGGAVMRTTVADPNNLYDYNSVNLMFKMSQPYTDA
nr:MAG: capsid protein [Virus sp.]